MRERIRRINRGVILGQWTFWVGFWAVLLWTNVRRELRIRRELDRHERDAQARRAEWAEGEAIPCEVPPWAS